MIFLETRLFQYHHMLTSTKKAIEKSVLLMGAPSELALSEAEWVPKLLY
jgi:hypothetical protein